MTFANTPLAVDGALVGGSLFRKGLMASVGSGGVAKTGDLKVSASVPNAQSLVIASGVAAVPNGYQTTPDELYIAANPGGHTVTSGDMPSASGSTTYWMVCLVVGDPAYDQTGHPFMPSDFSGEDPNTFQYVRPVLLACAATDTTFEQLGKPYPGIALARLQIPPSTTTITDAMITDLRTKAGTTPWYQLTPTGAFSGTIAYCKVNGIVYVEMAGSKSGTGGAVLGTLPVGFRPAIQVIRPTVQSSGVQSGVYVTTAGEIKSDFGVGGFGGFSFPAA